MKSPYSDGYDAYQDPFPMREIPIEEERLITQGYKFLGWQMSPEKTPEYRKCYNAAHNYRTAFPNAWREVQHNNSGSNVTQWCTICRIYWKTDMSG